MPITGEKPGIGAYRCINCQNLVKLHSSEDSLPTCASCHDTDFEKVKGSKQGKIIKEVLALIIWIYLFIKIFIFEIDIYIIQKYFPSFSWLFKYKFFIFIALLAILWMILRNKRFFGFILFTIVYPFFLLFWRIPKLLFKTKNWVGIFAALGILVSFFNSLKLNFMIFTLLSVSGLLIIISNAKFTLIPSIIVFFLFLILHFIRRFSYGFKKFSILNKYASSVIKFWQQVQSAIRSSEEQKTIQQKKTAEEEEANQRSNRLQWLLILNKACYFLASKLRYIQKGGIAFLYYFSSLLYSVFLVILVFAFQNLALYKIDPSSFNNPPKGKFMFFFYYSFNTLFKNNIPDFYPRGSLARLFNSTEIFFGFLVLVILVYLLFTIIREKHKEEIESSIIVIKKQGTELGKIIDNEYHLSVDQAIKEIEKIKGSMLKIIYYFMVNIE